MRCCAYERPKVMNWALIKACQRGGSFAYNGWSWGDLSDTLDRNGVPNRTRCLLVILDGEMPIRTLRHSCLRWRAVYVSVYDCVMSNLFKAVAKRSALCQVVMLDMGWWWIMIDIDDDGANRSLMYHTVGTENSKRTAKMTAEEQRLLSCSKARL